ncbi:ATP-binding protein [Bacillus sp. 165]|uniref:sensor histidine kinase n=1 Tax=Bacillus sp. 165 TaxID=1529117 RepID=UPI001ADC1150|nr:ATP-binding protein [Bacillus sp. 165]MBO9129499.1 sensor histidine kinase [Bacillus sp. 165]
MIPLLLCVIIALCILNYMQYRSRKRRTESLVYIHNKLSNIVSGGTSEKVLLFTDDEVLQNILVSLNRLLDHNRKVTANYVRTETSIKKMLSNMSHDLKTPLTVVLGLTETISHNQELTEEDRNRLVNKVHKKAEEILQLMNKFFDLAKLESGDKELPLSKINISEVCKNAILFFYESLTLQEFEVAIQIPERMLYALGNEEALERILHNLISNAIRYGKDGNIVGITLRNDSEHIFIDVWDRGKGISAQHKQLVFDRLYTLEDSRNHSYQGSGLGLAITKRLVEQIGGQIFLQSKPYEKTVFTVQLKRPPY